MKDSFDRYPYFIQPWLDELPGADPDRRKTLVRRIAAAVGPADALRTSLGIDPDEFRDFYNDAHGPVLDTESTIDSFLDRFSKEGAPDPEDIPEEVPLQAPAVDYAASMLGDSDVPESLPDDDTSALLNGFLPKQPPKPELSISLAKAMVKNGNYRKAIDIITEINLKNSKKSIYFADQIRFLQKLILTQESEKKLKTNK